MRFAGTTLWSSSLPNLGATRQAGGRARGGRGVGGGCTMHVFSALAAARHSQQQASEASGSLGKVRLEVLSSDALAQVLQQRREDTAVMAGCTARGW